MLVADNQGYYLEVNPAACALLDRPRHQLIGRCIADFLPPEPILRRPGRRFWRRVNSEENRCCGSIAGSLNR